MLVADVDCSADDLLGVLDDLPGVAAIPSLPLSSILFASARGRVREYRSAVAGSRLSLPSDEVREGMNAGRETLDAILMAVRSRTRCRHVVLHDARAFAFPLADAAGIKIIELVRREVPAESEVRGAIRATLNRLRGPDRFRNAAGYLQVDEQRVHDGRDNLRIEIAAFLDAPGAHRRRN